MNDKNPSSQSKNDPGDEPTDFSFLNDAPNGPVDASEIPDFAGITPGEIQQDAIPPAVDIEPTSDIATPPSQPTGHSTPASPMKSRDSGPETSSGSKLPAMLGGLSALIIGAFLLWPGQDDDKADEEVVDQGIPFVDPSENKFEADGAGDTPDVSNALFGIPAEEAKKKKKAGKGKPKNDQPDEETSEADADNAPDDSEPATQN